MENQTEMTAYYDTLWRTVISAAGTRTVQPLHRDGNGQLVARGPARVYAHAWPPRRSRAPDSSLRRRP